MISTFFDKSKPINYLILIVAVFVIALAVALRFQDWNDLGLDDAFALLGVFSLCFTIAFLGVTVKTQKLTSDNSYTMFFFSAFLMLMFEVTEMVETLLANLFLVFSFAKAMALKSKEKQKEKIFEAALYLFIACFFVPWTLLFLIGLYAAIAMFCDKRLKLWLMPLAAGFTTLMIALALFTVFADGNSFARHFEWSFTSDVFHAPNVILIGFYTLSFLIMALVFAKLGYRRLGRTLSLRLVAVYFILSVLSTIFCGKGDSGIYLFSLFPFAIFMANYVENIKKRTLKEMVLIGAIFIPSVTMIIRFF